jgi:hypothetical protein
MHAQMPRINRIVDDRLKIFVADASWFASVSPFLPRKKAFVGSVGGTHQNHPTIEVKG